MYNIKIPQETSDILFKKLTELTGTSSESQSNVTLKIRLPLFLSNEGFDRAEDLVIALNSNDTDIKERFIDEMLNHETYLFREEDMLREEIYQSTNFIENNGKCRILVAGCSSGDEAYTLGIIAGEMFPARAKQIDILGVDISQKMINMATEGAYNEYALRYTPSSIEREFFKKEDGKALIKKDIILPNITFKKVNITKKDEMLGLGMFDIISCRNTFIYFDTNVKKTTTFLFSKMLNQNGRVFLSSSEALESGRMFEAQVGEYIHYKLLGGDK